VRQEVIKPGVNSLPELPSVGEMGKGIASHRDHDNRGEHEVRMIGVITEGVSGKGEQEGVLEQTEGTEGHPSALKLIAELESQRLKDFERSVQAMEAELQEIANPEDPTVKLCEELPGVTNEDGWNKEGRDGILVPNLVCGPSCCGRQRKDPWACSSSDPLVIRESFLAVQDLLLWSIASTAKGQAIPFLKVWREFQHWAKVDRSMLATKFQPPPEEEKGGDDDPFKELPGSPGEYEPTDPGGEADCALLQDADDLFDSPNLRVEAKALDTQLGSEIRDSPISVEPSERVQGLEEEYEWLEDDKLDQELEKIRSRVDLVTLRFFVGTEFASDTLARWLPGAHKELLTRWVRAAYGAPHLTVTDGHVLITSVLEGAVPPPIQEVEGPEDTPAEEEAPGIRSKIADADSPAEWANYHAVRKNPDWVVVGYSPLGVHKLEEEATPEEEPPEVVHVEDTYYHGYWEDEWVSTFDPWEDGWTPQPTSPHVTPPDEIGASMGSSSNTSPESRPQLDVHFPPVITALEQDEREGGPDLQVVHQVSPAEVKRKVRIVSCGNYAKGVSEDVLYASGAAAETLRIALVRPPAILIVLGICEPDEVWEAMWQDYNRPPATTTSGKSWGETARYLDMYLSMWTIY
ncbi:GIP, partial [Symbiodinium necroappetens]